MPNFVVRDWINYFTCVWYIILAMLFLFYFMIFFLLNMIHLLRKFYQRIRSNLFTFILVFKIFLDVIIFVMDFFLGIIMTSILIKLFCLVCFHENWLVFSEFCYLFCPMCITCECKASSWLKFKFSSMRIVINQWMIVHLKYHWFPHIYIALELNDISFLLINYLLFNGFKSNLSLLLLWRSSCWHCEQYLQNHIII